MGPLEFQFSGSLPASKSILNRLLILNALEPRLRLIGESDSEDVRAMRTALEAFESWRKVAPPKPRLRLDAGAAGTTFRFLAFFLSRIPGQFELVGTRRLFERPQHALISVLAQLGVEAEVKDSQCLLIESAGWQKPSGPVSVDLSHSSQFLSGLVLSAWDLPFDLEIQMESAARAGQNSGPLSEGYWLMTKALVERLGMRFRAVDAHRFQIMAGAQITPAEVVAECDVSSAFAIAALAAIAGRAQLIGVTRSSLQPDIAFVEILKKMGVSVRLDETQLNVEKPEMSQLRPIEVHLGSSPDLFPVLAALCAFASGESKLFGAKQLKFKESNRIRKMAELLRLVGCESVEREDGLTIRPAQRAKQKPSHPSAASVSWPQFDPDQDHRMAMAAAVLTAGGYQIEILHREVVNKSFPQFWSIYEAGFGVKS